MTRKEQVVALKLQLLDAYMQQEAVEAQIRALRNLITGLEVEDDPPAPESSPASN